MEERSHAELAREFIERAQSRGATLPFAKAERAAKGFLALRRNGVKRIEVESLRKLPPALWRHARSLCEILNEWKGIDPRPYLQEPERLRREEQRRTARPSKTGPEILVDTIYIRNNGY